MTMEMYLTIWAIGMFVFLLAAFLIIIHHVCDYKKKQALAMEIGANASDMLEEYTDNLMDKMTNMTVEMTKKLSGLDN